MDIDVTAEKIKGLKSYLSIQDIIKEAIENNFPERKTIYKLKAEKE